MHRLFAIIAVAATIAASNASARAAESEAQQWRLVQSTGTVELSAGDSEQTALEPNTSLPNGAIIITGANGQSTLRRGSEQIIVQANTRLELTASNAFSTRFNQTSGAVQYKINKQQSPHFEVDTPFFAAVAKGTSFLVSVTPEHADVKVREGAVQVSTLAGSAVALVRSGQSAAVHQFNQSTVDVRDATGNFRSVFTNEGGWNDGTSSPNTKSGAALLRTNREPPPNSMRSALDSLGNSALSVELTSGSGNDPTANPNRASTDPAPHANLRQRTDDSFGISAAQDASPSTKAPRLRVTTSEIEGALSHRVDSAMRSISRYKPIKVSAEFPWAEFTYCLLALMGLMAFSHVRSLRQRTKLAASTSR